MSYCGGTLVASKYVISAAHCFWNDINGDEIVDFLRPADDISIRIGDHNLDVEGEEKITPKTVNVVRLTLHPNYNKDDLRDGYDIAILELEEELDLSVYTPACMARSSDATTFDGKTATVAGWGRIEENDPDSNSATLQHVDIPVVSQERCQDLFASSISSLSPSIICAGGEEGKDSCLVLTDSPKFEVNKHVQGDSGGPLTVMQNSQHVLIGDVSFGVQSAINPLGCGVVSKNWCQV